MTIEATQTEILKEARRVEEDALYSANGHFEDAKLWARVHLLIGVPAALLSALAGASALAQFDNHSIIAGVLALIVTALTAVATFLNPNQIATTHQNFGNQYDALKNQARIFCNIRSATETAEQDLVRQLDELNMQRTKLNQEAPAISDRAYKKAKRGIERGQADYKMDVKGSH